MKKCILGFVGFAIFFVLTVFCVACQRGSNDAQKTITELNQTFENSRVKITATDIIARQIPNSDDIAVAVNFTIENISRSDFTVSRFIMSVYIDDRLVTEGSGNAFEDLPGDSLIGTIAPGKRLVGYKTVKIPMNTKQIEMLWSDLSVSFVFDIPPVSENM